MKRIPVLVSFILFLALCASLAYWALQVIRPPVRPMAAPAPAAVAEARLDSAAGLFGGRPVALAAASNYQLKGVVVAANGRESIAILSADGKPAQAVGINVEMQPGVVVKEVHSQYILLSEGGVIKRVALPEGAKAVQQAEFTTGALPPLGAAGAQPPGFMRPPPEMPAPLVNHVMPAQQMNLQQEQGAPALPGGGQGVTQPMPSTGIPPPPPPGPPLR